MNAKRILVVEDDKVTQKLIADSLRAAGYEVFTADSSATAVQLAREKDPDLVTLDVELTKDSPDDSWDGFSIAGWLNRLNQGTAKPVLVVISGSREPGQLVEKAAAVGVYTCLTKPIEKQKLLDTVAAALQASQS
jgi:two-component system, OmpR family, response regulator